MVILSVDYHIAGARKSWEESCKEVAVLFKPARTVEI